MVTNSGGSNINNNSEGGNRLFGWNSDFLTRCLNKSNYHPLNRRGDGDVGAGHVGRYISLANPDRASQMSCHIPAVLIFGFTAVYMFSVLYYMDLALFLFTAVTLYSMGYALFMAVGGLYGVFRIRTNCAIDWNKKCMDYIAANPGCTDGMLHFVILPNYAEDFEMLSTTINNIANNCLAKDYLVVVLAMEAREGEEGKRKAEMLIARHKHLFRGMLATFHPPNIPCEVKGKSSNTQWAFREIQRWYGSYVSQDEVHHDTSKVFITVGDADSIHHAMYFPYLTVVALQKPAQERSWTMWQAPVLMFRNMESACAMLRNTACGTFLYEVSGLSAAELCGIDHLCFSCYSLTLALANHPIVDGWDTDVIAEDHHMSIKCMSASYWEDLFSSDGNGNNADNSNSWGAIRGKSRWRIEPIWAPVNCYLVEDPSKELLKSLKARYDQARRHMQGIAEFSYILLQYYSIITHSNNTTPLIVHIQYLHLAVKVFSISAITALHAACWVHFFVAAIYYAGTHFYAGDLQEQIAVLLANNPFVAALFQSEDIGSATFMMALAMFPVFAFFICVIANTLVITDAGEGKHGALHFNNLDQRKHKDEYSNYEYIHFLPDHKGNFVTPLSRDEEEALQIRAPTTDSITSKNAAYDWSTGKKQICSTSSKSYAPYSNAACVVGKSEKPSNLIKTVALPNSDLTTNTVNPNPNSTLNIATAKGTVVRKLVSRTMNSSAFWKLAFKTWTDFNVVGQPTLFLFGTIPMYLTVFSLSRYGHKFDYIVAAKPQAEQETTAQELV